MRLLLLLSTLLIGDVAAGAASRQAAVNKAIEQTKSRQSAAQTPARVPGKQSQSSGRNEFVDVDKLNRLIRALDKTWIMPRAGSKDPVGSNFQYKKTCASIYKARHGACQQLGFGVMCFNYCHERGEKLSFRCQDASDATYCRQSGTFETFLAKYRKDGYKAKAYIHQMISRCYATSICNTQSGILNSTIIDEEEAVTEKTTRVNRLRLLTRAPKGGKATTTTTEATPVEEEPELSIEEEATTPKPSKKKATLDKKRASPRPKTTKNTPVPEETTTAKPNIWDKFTVGQKAKPTPKYIPFWQKLITSTTMKPNSGEGESEISSEAEIEQPTPGPEETPEPEEQTVEVTEEVTEAAPVTTQRPKVVRQGNPTERHTFKPLPMTTPPPPGPELAFQKPGDGASEQGPGFWNRFQPNRWYQSIHYVTNTGK